MGRDDHERHFRLLRRAWHDRRLVLFLGAGVSASRNIPTWNQLVIDLIVSNTKRFRRLAPNYREAVGDWLGQALDFTPLTLTRAFKTRLASKTGKWTQESQRNYLAAIQSGLYSPPAPATATDADEPPDCCRQAASDTLSAVAALIDRSEKSGRHVAAVITTNFDDLLETELANVSGIRHRVVYDGTNLTADGTLPILHVHGFIPRKGVVPTHQIVFAEDEYHELSYSMFNWALSELVHFLRTSTVLFVGFGMTDPNIRRLLDATRDPRAKTKHVVVRRDVLSESTAATIAQQIDRRAVKYDPSFQKTPPALANDIGAAVRQAKKFDEELLTRLGVGVVSVPCFCDIPAVLARIAT